MEEKHVKEIIVNLIVLGKLDTGMKLNTRSKDFVIDDYNWYQGISRLWRRDDRSVTTDKISQLVKETAETIEFIQKNNEESITIEKLDGYIEGAIKGLNNLMTTYADDVTTCAKLEVEIETLTKIKNKIKLKNL
jgi:hypothetical protein